MKEGKKMMMKNLSPIIKGTILLALMLVFISPALAGITITKYDHHQYLNNAYGETFVCSCGTTMDYYDVTNAGDFPAVFRFTMEAEMDWVTLLTHEAYLQPGESTRIAVSVHPPCGLEMDPPYRIFSTSQYGRFTVAERHVTATVCESIQFTVQQFDHEALPCRPADFELIIRNVAPYTETYDIRTNSQDVTLATNSLRLAPNEEARVPATAQFSCDVYGTQNIRFTVEAAGGSVHRQDAQVHIQRDYEFTVETLESTEQAICSQVESTRTVRITNIAQTTNTYTLQYSGIGFVTLDRQEVVLQPGQSRDITVRIQPEKRHQGVFPGTVTVRSEYGGVVKTLPLSVEVRDCFQNTITVTPPAQTICAGWGEFGIRVENRGDFPEEYTIRLGGELFSELTSESRFALRPGEHFDTGLRVSVPDMDDTWTVELLVEQTPGIQERVVIPVTSVSNIACHMIRTSEQKLTVFTDEEVYPVILRNDGIRAATYLLSLESTVVRLAEQGESVFLAPGEETVIHLVLENIQDVSLGQHVAVFSATSDRAEYRKDFHITIREKGFFQQFYEKARYGNAGLIDWCMMGMILLGAILIILGVLFILSTANNTPFTLSEQSTGYLKVAFLVLAALFTVLAITTALMSSVPVELADEPRGTNATALFHEFAQNTQYRLDLDMYFFDPDGHPLVYTHSQPADLNINIRDNIAIITPRRGFSGESRVVFTAQDIAGDTVSSPPMTIAVLRVQPTSFWQWIRTYCTSINFALLAAIMLILFLFVQFSRPSELIHIKARPPAKRGVVVDANKEVVPVRRGRPRVNGDVVAGDKITIVNQRDQEIYVASKNGTKFHPIDSHFVARMPKELRVVFNSKAEAIKAGYVPSKQVR